MPGSATRCSAFSTNEGYKGLYAGLGVKAIKARKGSRKRTISWTVSGYRTGSQ